MIEESQVYNIFRQSCLFKVLGEDELSSLSKKAQIQQFKAGDAIYSTAENADALFFITNGKVRLLHQENEKSVSLGVLTVGDFFGVECLLPPFQRNFTALSEEDTTILSLDKKILGHLASQNDRFYHTLLAVIKTRERVPKHENKWKENDEFILLSAHRHLIFLWFPCFFSLLAGMLGFSFIILGVESNWQWLWIFGTLIFLFAAGIGIWFIVDYFNDAYYVTTQRLVCVEKIFGLYETRQEAPLSSVRALDITTSWFSRTLGYGTISIRTFTSNILFENIGNPQFVADLIDEYQQRFAKKRSFEKEQNIRTELRKALGMDESDNKQKFQALNSSKSSNLYPFNTQKRLNFVNGLFKMRIYDTEGVTFRKHWIILMSKVWLPLLSLIATLWVWIAFISSEQIIKIIPFFEGSLFFSILTIFCLLWGFYHVWDWSNDIYRVTDNQIIDMEKKPFGRENTKTASLESVLSVTVVRKNLIGLLFNFGDVNIDAGGTIFTFHNIAAPNSACAEISKRVEQLREKTEQTKVIEENRRYLEWLAAYHKEIKSEGDVSE